MKSAVISGLIALSVSFLAVQFFSPTGQIQSQAEESVYDRVMRTGTIRCGYALWGSFLQKDANTGEFSGIMYDYMTQLASNIGLEVEWVEETGWGDAITALDTNRFDVWCAGMGWNAERARMIDYVTPLTGLKSEFYVRADDFRFDYDIQKFNQEGVTLAVLEGEFYGKVMMRDFPLAEALQHSQLSPLSDLFSNVVTGKADGTLAEVSTAQKFLTNNPGALRAVPVNEEFLSVPVSLTLKHGELKFRRMLDISTQEMADNGSLDSILRKYETPEITYTRVNHFNYR